MQHLINTYNSTLTPYPCTKHIYLNYFANFWSFFSITFCSLFITLQIIILLLFMSLLLTIFIGVELTSVGFTVHYILIVYFACDEPQTFESLNP